jgi:quinol monooxygenase YgiN
MFVITVKFRVAKGKEEALKELFRKARERVYEEEEKVVIYDMHRRSAIYLRYYSMKDTGTDKLGK